jgi:hypothetical protein
VYEKKREEFKNRMLAELHICFLHFISNLHKEHLIKLKNQVVELNDDDDMFSAKLNSMLSESINEYQVEIKSIPYLTELPG